MPAKKKKSAEKSSANTADSASGTSGPQNDHELNEEYYEDLDAERETTDTGETEDIYNAEQRDEMLQEDEITSDEAAFMDGNEIASSGSETRKKKKFLEFPTHEDTPSVELAEADAQRDDATTDTESD